MLIVALICVFLLTFIVFAFLQGDHSTPGDAALALIGALCATFLFYYLT